MSSRYDIHPMEAKFQALDADRKKIDAQIQADWEAVAQEGHDTESAFRRGFHLGANFARLSPPAPAPELLERAAEALESAKYMSDLGDCPGKLDEALTWRENDALARRRVDEALAAIRSHLSAAQPAEAAPTDAEMLSKYEQQYLLGHPDALLILMEHCDMNQEQSDSMGADTYGDLIRHEVLRRKGAAVIATDPECFDAKLRERFAAMPEWNAARLRKEGIDLETLKPAMATNLKD